MTLACGISREREIKNVETIYYCDHHMTFESPDFSDTDKIGGALRAVIDLFAIGSAHQVS